MSCIRYLTRSRASVVARIFLHQPPIAHFDRNDDGDSKSKDSSPSLQRTKSFSSLARFQNASKIGLLRSPARFSGFPASPSFGASFYRSLSTGNRDSGHSDIYDYWSENVGEIASSAPAAVVNEVAVAAADSFYPVALVQHFIEAVHCYTGFNWWSSIVIAALINRGVLLLPLNLYVANHALLLRTHNANQLKQLQQKLLWALREFQKYEVDNAPIYEALKIVNESLALLARSVAVNLMKVAVHVCFFLGISNMAERVSSFQTGGASWFLDLSTPDSHYMFPLLVALSIWFPWKAKEISRNGKIPEMGYAGTVLGLLSVPCTMGIPKAVLIYWIAHVIFHNLFTALEYAWLKEKGPIF